MNRNSLLTGRRDVNLKKRTIKSATRSIVLD